MNKFSIDHPFNPFDYLTGEDEKVNSEITHNDLLGWYAEAEKVAKTLNELDCSERGAVVGINGSWGSGKTSYMNCIKFACENSREFKYVQHVIQFDPWYFQSSEDLLISFFRELSAGIKQFDGDNNALRTAISKYGAYILPWVNLAIKQVPIVGDQVQETAKQFIDFLSKEPTSLSKVREEVINQLKLYRQKILIFIDDIDRLQNNELLIILKLIRLIGDLPQLIFIVAYDEERVLDVLQANKIDKDYLQKIIQVPINLPEISKYQLLKIICSDITKLVNVDKRIYHPLDARAVSIINNIVLRNITTLRQYRRLMYATYIKFEKTDGEIDFFDILALETLRIYLRSFYDSIIEKADSLTDFFDSNDRNFSYPNDLTLAHYVLELIFPAYNDRTSKKEKQVKCQQKWHDQRRVANRNIFYKYIYLSNIASNSNSYREIYGDQWSKSIIEDEGNSEKLLFDRFEYVTGSTAYKNTNRYFENLCNIALSTDLLLNNSLSSLLLQNLITAPFGDIDRIEIFNNYLKEHDIPETDKKAQKLKTLLPVIESD